MRLVIQRVTEARVSADGLPSGSIDTGLLVLVAVAKTDATSDADYLAEKLWDPLESTCRHASLSIL